MSEDIRFLAVPLQKEFFKIEKRLFPIQNEAIFINSAVVYAALNISIALLLMAAIAFAQEAPKADAKSKAETKPEEVAADS